jgi:uncharacterized protein (UPF0248 family)
METHSTLALQHTNLEASEIKQEKTKLQAQPTVTKFLRPSDQIVDRIRWDSTFNIALLKIGYLDRFLGEMICDIQEFDIGDIPYHRIIYLQYDGLLVWDRETKLDLITCNEYISTDKESQVPIVRKDKKKKNKKETKQINAEVFTDEYWLSDEEDVPEDNKTIVYNV